MTTPPAPPPPDPHTVVRPPPFDLYLQLVTPAEQDALARGQTPSSFTFGGRDFELVWGGDVIPGTTEAEAVVRMNGLDGNIEEGMLRLGTRQADDRLVESFKIPVRQVRVATTQLERQIAMRLVNLGYLNTIDAPPSSLLEGMACFLHQLPERGVDVPAQAGALAWHARAVDHVEWPYGTALLRAILARLEAACGEHGGAP